MSADDLEVRLQEAFAHGRFDQVRRLAQGAEDRALAARYLARIAPPRAAVLGLTLTAALVMALSLYFVLTRH